MGESRSDPKTRKLAVLLSALELTPDDALEGFRDRRAADRSLDPQNLRRARVILDAVGHAILDRDMDRWRRLQDASRLLEQDASRAPVDEAAAAVAPPRPSQPGPARPADAGSAPEIARAEAVAPLPPAAVGAMPWASVAPVPVPAPAPVRPPIAAPELAPAPPQALADRMAMFEALNRIQIDESQPATMCADESQPTGPALPFRQSGGAKPPPAAVAGASDAASPGATATGQALSPLRGTSLPFRHSASGSAEADDGTSVLALPAKPGPAAAAASVEPEPAQAPSPPVEPARAAPGAPEEPPGSAPGAGLLATELAPHLAALTVEQYATLCAECASHPAWVAEILARYGVQSEAERAALTQHWEQRMAADPQLAGLLRWHYARYEEWLKQQQR
jgi:hypothetical protein